MVVVDSKQIGSVQDPIKVIEQSLKQKKIIGLGEAHWFQKLFNQLSQLILAPEIESLFSDIVVECGNSKHQNLLDDFISGKEVAPEELQSIWLDSIVFPAWLPPQYGDLFYQIRKANFKRTTPIKVHLTEPSFEWQDIKSKAEFIKINGNRDFALFEYVKKNLLQENKAAIVLVGARHLLKSEVSNRPIKSHASFGQLMHKNYPDKLLSIWPHILTEPPAWVKDKSHSQRYGYFDTQNREIKNITFDEIAPVKPMFNLFSSAKLSSLVDGYLYLGVQERELSISPHLYNTKWCKKMAQRQKFLNQKQQMIVKKVIEK
ncbi:hypothetical protein CJF42_04770 [Pseudoalteromonas sp. NBT06-2]|uniref:hypothetical protein n=1 Tax=Pseudoalteromonas sp. NBT06-2 TaxID=2025950 RepID=UPI000BA71FBD|nr:hypothetical protein [Pseudoalteromonas sp. NBT06-2]PAJ75455.1 hypothetical protein CJF42_04770 [Pseudoalteromonas sp. NBT06-2]